jgi:alpha,alpha-trehalase
MELFKVNRGLTYVYNPYAEENKFLHMPVENNPLPLYENSKDKLPKPIWDGHENYIKCYDYAWKLAFNNLRTPNAEAGFVSNFIDTAFNGFLFMWDSSFIVLFGKYGAQIFDFQKTLDNFYSHQHYDGFICREICESENGEQFCRYDPSGTGPNIMPWSEWESYLQTGDKERISKIFAPLLAYHLWLKENHTWRDGTYFSTGLGCGMDNQHRQQKGTEFGCSHGHMIWMDTCAQQVLSANILIKMAKILGRENEDAVKTIEEESAYLTKYINEKLWSEKDAYYYDMYRDGSLNGVKTIGAYWALLAGIVPDNRIDAFVAHLDNPNEFKRPNRVPTVSADDESYSPVGDYWNGSVWAPTNYMVLKGLDYHGYNKLAYEIASTCLDNVVEVFNSTGTIWENYAPETADHGSHSKDKFVGWSGLFPISIMFEYVFGIRPEASKNTIVWYVNRTERHGIERYPFNGETIDLVCETRNNENEKPVITVKSPKPIKVELHWGDGKTEIIEA